MKRIALVGLAMVALATSANGQQLDVRQAVTRKLAEPEITLLIQQFGGEFEKWVRNYSETAPTSVRFRWSTMRNDLATAEYQVLIDPDDGSTLVARGPVAVPQPGQSRYFTVDFQSIVGGKTKRPLTYWVRVAGRKPLRAGARPRPSDSVMGVPVRVNFVAPGAPTEFTELPESVYEADHDRDGLPDLKEYYLAEQFKPAFVFDGSEAHRRPNEPVILFQVRPDGCSGSRCPKPLHAWIKYTMLFAEDGGYGPSSSCVNAHNGDNQPVDMKIRSDDGEAWTLAEIHNSHYVWPGWSVEFWYDQLGRQTHPVIYLSAHKHHQYFDTSNDEEDSPYSGWGCNDDVNGKGVRVWAELLSPTKRPNNVGEPEAHPTQHFVGDLGAYGYPGENAWGGRAFKGGLGDDGGDTSVLSRGWMRHPFEVRR